VKSWTCRPHRALLELLQSKGAVLQVGIIMGRGWGAAGLSALTGPGCRVVFNTPFSCDLRAMLLDAPDITAIASTWGSQLTTLTLACRLTLAACAALTASNFPRLKSIKGLDCSDTDISVFSTGLEALCISWPRDRQLRVTVAKEPTVLTIPIIMACREALQASGSTNVTVTLE
jgi:hypothetical protein